MVRIFPFAAVRPVRDAAPQVAAVPYDVVTAEEARIVIRDNPMSFLRISRPDAELPELAPTDPRVYTHAKDRFSSLMSSGVLARDPGPGMYIYRVITPTDTYIGLCCCLHVDDYESGIIRRHEQTRYDKEEDRTRHIDTVNAQTGPVVLIYRDSGDLSRSIASLAVGCPDEEVHWKDGSIHQVFRISDARVLSLLEGNFSQVGRLYIADGHHRAKSAVNVARRRRDSGDDNGEAERFMGVLFADSGVRIHGYSRLVRDLGGRTPGEFMKEISRTCSVLPYVTVNNGSFQISPRTDRPHVFHMYLERIWYECSLPDTVRSDLINSLDVSLLQRQVLEGILGIKDPRGDPRLQYLGGARPVADLEAMVDRGDYAVAFSMQPLQVDTVLSIADKDGIMPPKSTWFEPKLLSGLVIHSLS